MGCNNERQNIHTKNKQQAWKETACECGWSYKICDNRK